MKLLSRIASLVMAMTICLAMTMTMSFADMVEFTDTDIKSIGGEATAEDVNSFLANSVKQPWALVLLSTDANEGNSAGDTILVGNTTYYVRDGHTASELKNRVISAYKSSKTTQDTYDLTQDIGVTADTSAAMQALSGLIPYVNILLGIMVTLITLGLAIFTAFDVCYISFPVFRNKCEQQKMEGQGAMVKQTANGGTKLRWVSEEAQYAVDHASLEQGSHPLSNYLKNRILAYVFVAIILFILLTGNISIISNLALKAVAGIMDVLQGLS